VLGAVRTKGEGDAESEVEGEGANQVDVKRANVKIAKMTSAYEKEVRHQVSRRWAQMVVVVSSLLVGRVAGEWRQGKIAGEDRRRQSRRRVGEKVQKGTREKRPERPVSTGPKWKERIATARFEVKEVHLIEKRKMYGVANRITTPEE
jgi:hypothetical protein